MNLVSLHTQVLQDKSGSPCPGTTQTKITYYETTYRGEKICFLNGPDGGGVSDEDTLKQLFSQLPGHQRVKGLLYFDDLASELVEEQKQVSTYWC